MLTSFPNPTPVAFGADPVAPRRGLSSRVLIAALALLAGLLVPQRDPPSAIGGEPDGESVSGKSSPGKWKLAPDECFLVDDFNGDIQNRVGGYRNVFFRDPSWAMTRRERGDASGSTAPTGRGRVLRLSGRRAEAGFCGAWVHLFDMRSRRPVYLDASKWNFLTF